MVIDVDINVDACIPVPPPVITATIPGTLNSLSASTLGACEPIANNNWLFTQSVKYRCKSSKLCSKTIDQ